MSDTDKNELWKIIARACCPKRTHDCMRCIMRLKCVERAQLAADNIRKVYIITTRHDDSVFKQASLNDLPEAQVVENTET